MAGNVACIAEAGGATGDPSTTDSRRCPVSHRNFQPSGSSGVGECPVCLSIGESVESAPGYVVLKDGQWQAETMQLMQVHEAAVMASARSAGIKTLDT